MSRPDPFVLMLSVPGLRREDLVRMPVLAGLAATGTAVPLAPPFPAVTCPVQATLTTGTPPAVHGIEANGLFDRGTRHLEMWISPDGVHRAPRIWDRLKAVRPDLRTAAWFLLQSKHATADLVCLPAPKHNPDGTETMWCHTNPEPLYAALRDTLGDFPLHRFWGPLAGIDSTRWIIRSFLQAADAAPPQLAVVYLPHLDYAAQRSGPDSPPALAACGELDAEIGALVAAYGDRVGADRLEVIVAGEYRIRPVSRTLYPNRLLRAAGLLTVRPSADGDLIDMERSAAWALADHQVSHVYLRAGVAGAERERLVAAVRACFAGRPEVGRVIDGAGLVAAGLDVSALPGPESRCGDLVVECVADAWQAYPWWIDVADAPRFARTIDIHRKPGYDPLELHVDRTAPPPPGMPFGIPLDTTLVAGSHGSRDESDPFETLLVASRPGFASGPLHAHDVAGLVLGRFGVG